MKTSHCKGYSDHNDSCRRAAGGALLPALLLTAGWLMPSVANAAFVSADADVTYVQNVLTNSFNAAITDALGGTFTYGAVTAVSVSPCTGAGCQSSSGGNADQETSANSATSGAIPSAAASATLASGILQADTSTGGVTSGSAAAGSAFWDTLTFTNTTGLSQSVQVNDLITGSFTGPTGDGVGGACQGYAFSLTEAGSVCTGTGSNPLASGATILNSGNPSENLTLSFNVAPGTSTMLYTLALAAGAQNSAGPASANLVDPPVWILPTGVSYTTTVPLATPLPPAMWLFGSGAAWMLWLAMRRRRPAPVQAV